MVKVWNLVFTILLVISTASEIMAELTVSIEPEKANVSDELTLKIVLEDISLDSSPEVQNTPDFSLRSNGTESSTSYTNGKISTRFIYTYSLLPKRTGTLNGPDIIVSQNGKPRIIPSGTVEISKDNIQSLGNKELLFRQSVNKSSSFEGEQVVNTLAVYTRVNVSDLQIQGVNRTDLWAEPFNEPSQYSTTVRGVRYRVYAERNALFPLSSGGINLEGRIVTALVPVRRKKRSLFDLDPFGRGIFSMNSTKPVRLISNPVTMTVLPLPKPEEELSLLGLPRVLVGATSISVIGNPEPVKTGKSKTLSIEISSRGNLNPLKRLELPEIENVRVFVEKPLSSIKHEKGYLIFKKTFKVSLIPSTGGDFTFPAVELTYFDPVREKYKKAKSEGFSFSVKGAPASASPSTEVRSSEAEPSEALKAQSLKSDTVITLSQIIFIVSALFIAILVLLVWGYLIRPLSLKRKSVHTVRRAAGTTELCQLFENWCRKRLSLQGSMNSETLKCHVRLLDLSTDISLKIELLYEDLTFYNYSGQTCKPEVLSRLKGELITVFNLDISGKS